ncbi:GlcG/HbpS family heme-binding protein [Salinicola acroporae]|uniref:GlcG protein n=1 Tax=Salinicola acroporae TaxID=1541440 RepID=A0ABT6I3X6_9GAMM|nr:heme-binding protein [Salinicola acroporae]MDH4572380.1 GlcG protein [Salinicola acroporae]
MRNVYPTHQTLSLAQARRIIDAALAHAEAEAMNPITVTVMDTSGHPLSCDRADGCATLRLAVAHGKARAALGYGISSGTIGQRNESRPAFLSAVAAASQGEFIPVAGGVLILDSQERVIGAVGVSGDSSENDEKAAIAGIEAAELGVGLAP